MRARAAVAALLGAGLAIRSPQVAAQSPPVFATGVEAVHVDAFVTHDGAAVAGLRASDFELRDNDVVQQVELVEAATRPLSAVMVFDASSSLLEHGRLDALRAAAGAFLDGLRPADEAALVAFAEEIAWLAGPTADKEAVRAALGRLEAAGATALFDALYAAVSLSEARGRGLVVLFTDGRDNVSILRAEQLRTTVRRADALVHVVRWTAGTEEENDQDRDLRQVAESSGGRAWTAGSPGRLRETFAAIARGMGERYVLRYEPTRVRRDGWHRLEVRLRGVKGRVHARQGYWVAPLR